MDSSDSVIVLTHVSETFGPEHRPIIEFAIENSQKLKLRASRAALAKGRQARTAANKDGFKRHGDGSNKAKKWESKKGEESSAGAGRSANDSSEAHDGDQLGKRKRENRSKKKNPDQKMEAVFSKEGRDTEVKGSDVKGNKLSKKRQKLEEGSPGMQGFSGRDNSKKFSSGQTKSSITTPVKVQGDNKARVTPQVPDEYLQNILSSNSAAMPWFVLDIFV